MDYFSIYICLICNSIVCLMESADICTLNPMSTGTRSISLHSCVKHQPKIGLLFLFFFNLRVLTLLFSEMLNLAILIVVTWIKLYSMPREYQYNLQKGRCSQKWSTWEIRVLFKFSTSVRVLQMEYEFQNVPAEKKNVPCYCLSLFQMLLTLSWLREMERTCQIS